MIRFACPRCGMQLSAPEDCAGRVSKCRACGQPVTVPQPVAVAVSAIPLRPAATPSAVPAASPPVALPVPEVLRVGDQPINSRRPWAGTAFAGLALTLGIVAMSLAVAPQHGNPLLGRFCLLVFAVVIVGGIGLLIWYQAQQQAAANHQKDKDKEYYRLTTGWFKSLEVGVIEHNRELSDILQDLYVLHSQLRITIPIGFAERIGELRAQVDRMNRRKIAPNFCQLCYTVLNQYAGVSRLANTEVRNFGITGGGFGITGAMKGILLAEGFNMINRQFGKAKTNAIVRAMQACLARAEEVLSTFKKIFP